ncbi:autotransporter domain-containing protein [Pseudomonas aeruginosa]|uniref:autotransporter domain-containing protein n=1 Tax=Pseudomonas aeruginosa TaxID=287 RepID=UPI001A1D191F|nr:autotransporter outer membrane beta-barrel domain-containing protein [Pseudomonas aeruginosa]MBI8241787.1 autotransporter outer membrane beta-barrel domain-containing protein [Pseudomonas aeruginosa]
MPAWKHWAASTTTTVVTRGRHPARLQLGRLLDALWPTGWYPDDVLQYIYLDIDTTSKQTYDLDNHGQVYTASLEGGYPFEVGEGLYVEPQLQATYNPPRPAR